MLVRTGPPSSGPAGPLALTAVAYERVLPGVKHVGEVAKTYFLREAVGQGFDDAAFVDRRGRLVEATIWNLAFWTVRPWCGRTGRCWPGPRWASCAGSWTGSAFPNGRRRSGWPTWAGWPGPSS